MILANPGLRLASCLVLVLGAALPSVGATQAKRFEITPMFGYVIGGTFEDAITEAEIELDDSAAIGLQFNIRADARSWWEIQYTKQEARVAAAGGVDVIVEKFELGGVYETSTGVTRPYAAATIGVSRFDPAGTEFNDDSYFSFSLGGGVRFFTDKSLGLIVDARWIAAVVDADTDIFCRSDFGLTCLIQTDSGLASQLRAFIGVSGRF